MRFLEPLAGPIFLRNLRALDGYLPSNTKRSLGFIAVMSLLVGAFESIVVVAIGSAVAALQGVEGATSQFVLPIVGDVGGWLLLAIVWVATGLGLAIRALVLQVSTALGVFPMAQARERLVTAYFSSAAQEQQSERLGEIGDLLVNQAPRVGLILSNVAATIAALTVLAVLVVCAVIVDPLTFLMMVAAVLLGTLIALPLQRAVRERGAILSAAMLDYSVDAAELVGAATEVRLFDARNVAIRRLQRSSDVAVAIIRRLKVFIELSPAVYRSITIALLLSGLLLLSAFDVRNVAQVGTVTLLLLRATLETQSIYRLALASNEHMPFLEKIRDRVGRYTDSEVRRGAHELTSVQTIALHDASFSYRDADAPAVQRLNVAINAGERVGIAGHSGSGKTTMVGLLLGLLEPTNGAVLVNERAPGDYTAASWARQIAAIGQSPQLLRAPVSENIRFFREWVSDEDVQWAAEAAGIHDEITQWPLEYETEIGAQGSRRLSGGQSQRVCIARALAGRPSLLLLDEPTSALDAAAEGVIAGTIAALGNDCTVVVVSHRPATLKVCDRIITITDGELADSQ